MAIFTLVVYSLNVFGGVVDFERRISDALVRPSNLAILVFLIPSVLSAVFKPLRWMQVLAFVAVGFASAYASTTANLTAVTWLFAGLLLAWQYGFFRSNSVWRITTVIGLYVAVWAVGLAVRNSIFWTESLIILAAGTLLFYVVWIIVIFRAREAQRRAAELEEEVATRTAELRGALSDQEELTRELHHQTKNNLQILSATLSLEAARAHSSDTPARLDQLSSRIEALGDIQSHLLDSQPPGQVDLTDFSLRVVEDMHTRVDAAGARLSSKVQVHGVVDSRTAVEIGYLIVETLLGTVETLQASVSTRLQLTCERQEDLYVIEVMCAGNKTEPSVACMIENEMYMLPSVARGRGGNATLHTEEDGSARWRVTYPIAGRTDYSDASATTSGRSERSVVASTERPPGTVAPEQTSR
jgi:hypothetical protein